MRRDPALFRVAVVVLTLSLATAAVHADMIVFKDGFVLHGKVSRDGETIADPASGQAITIPRGPFYIIDGARRVTFSFLIVEEAVKKDIYENVDVVRVEQRVSRLNAYAIDVLNEIVGATEWNDKWERVFTYRTMRGAKPWKVPVEQRLGVLTPQFARIDARKFNWSSFHLTSEFDPEVVRTLLYNHPDLKEQGNKGDVARRLRIYRFFTQAGWYKQAAEELDNFARVFPDEKEKLNDAREHLKGLTALETINRIEQAHKTGQHALAQKLLTAFPRDVEEKIVSRARALDEKYESANKSLALAQRYLKELPSRLSLPFQQKLFGEASEVISAELNLDNVLRLESFLKLALQAELDRAQGRSSDNGPPQLLSLAVTGWLLGKDAAENKVESAQRLWRSRRFVLDYVKTPEEPERARMLAAYQKQKYDVIAADELGQMLQYLPPVQPEKDLGTEPIELRTGPVDGHRKGVAYTVKLPPEYTHSRSYPVLVALHQSGENPSDMIDRLATQAAQQGVILVAPAWQGSVYAYTPEEHATVTEVIRDLKRHFKVDCDRTFLLGFGEGGTMAFDVGLSHPDLFAGIIPVSATACKQFSKSYLYNAQYLPFYVVTGTHSGVDNVKQIHQQFEKWLPEGYPALHVEYKGRGLEWFSGEVPSMFEWMSRKKRAPAFPELGGRRDFTTMRPTDSRFYWLTSDVIREANVNDPRNFRSQVQGATLQGRISEGNQVSVTAKGVKQVTVWLGRDHQGRDMIDFSKPVTIRLNSTVVVNNRVVKADMATLLEDFYDRGDAQRMFFAKFPFDLR